MKWLGRWRRARDALRLGRDLDSFVRPLAFSPLSPDPPPSPHRNAPLLRNVLLRIPAQQISPTVRLLLPLYVSVSLPLPLPLPPPAAAHSPRPTADTADNSSSETSRSLSLLVPQISFSSSDAFLALDPRFPPDSPPRRPAPFTAPLQISLPRPRLKAQARRPPPQRKRKASAHNRFPLQTTPVASGPLRPSAPSLRSRGRRASR